MLNMEKLKLWYPKLWNKKMMANAVKKGAIIAEQYKEITGEDYPG